MSEQLSTQVRVSVVIPARNEAPSVGLVVKKVRELLPGAELIVVNDGSSDATSAVARAAGATVIDHPYSKGNGASIKTGAGVARRAAERTVRPAAGAWSPTPPLDEPVP